MKVAQIHVTMVLKVMVMHYAVSHPQCIGRTSNKC